MAQAAEVIGGILVIRKQMVHMTHEQLALKPASGPAGGCLRLGPAAATVDLYRQESMTTSTAGLWQELWLCFRLAHHDIEEGHSPCCDVVQLDLERCCPDPGCIKAEKLQWKLQDLAESVWLAGPRLPVQ